VGKTTWKHKRQKEIFKKKSLSLTTSEKQRTSFMKKQHGYHKRGQNSSQIKKIELKLKRRVKEYVRISLRTQREKKERKQKKI
jgi:hypothetical protein